MKFLAIDTSGGAVCVAAANGIKEAWRAVEGVTSVCLMDAIDGVLREVGLAAADVGFIACVTGPGSFTGIRIGIATAKGLCFALGKKALALTSFDLLAYAETERALCLVDAGHGNYYACPFANGAAGQPCFLSERELDPYRDGGYRFLSGKPLAVESGVTDIRRGLLQAARTRAAEAGGAQELRALYLRKSSAEEKR